MRRTYSHRIEWSWLFFAGFEVDFPSLLLEVIHERAFKALTTYLFPCMIFELYKVVGVPIWHIDVLRTPTVTVDIGLINNEANEEAPKRGTRVEVQTLGEKLTITIEQGQRADHDFYDPTDTTQVESTLGTSGAPSSSQYTSSAALVPISRVQNLEAQMAILLHHIHSLMQKSIAEAEDRIKKKIAQQIQWQILEVPQRLDAFEFRLLTLKAPSIDLMTL